MCINNATNILSSQGISNLNGIESQVFDLADRLFAEYQSRYGEE